MTSFKIDYVFPFLGALLLCLVLFWPTVSKGVWPMATDILTGYHQPWINLHFEGVTFPFPVKNLESFDTVRQNFPWKYLVVSQYKKGQWPLWNPSQLSGVPLAAEFLAGAFYPLNVILIFLPFASGWGILAILQVYFAFITMYLFLRSSALSKLPSTFGAILFALSGFIAGFFHAGVIDHAFLWTPLVLFGVNQLFKTKNVWWIVVIGMAISLTGLASHLQILLYTSVLSFVYILAKFYLQRDKRLLITAVIGLGVGILITSVQLIPTLELLSYGNRIKNFSGQVPDILSPIHHLLLFWAPNFLGNPGNQNYFGGPSYYHEYSFYMGIPTLLFMFIALFQLKRRRMAMFWFGVIAVTLLMVLKSPLANLPRNLGIPLLGSITPTRMYAYTDLAIAVLASLGLEIFLRSNWKDVKKGLYLFIGIGTICFSVVFLNAKTLGSLFLKYLFDTTPAHNIVSLRSLIFPIMMFLFSVAVIGYALKKRNGVVISVLMIFLLVANIGDLMRQFRLQNGFVSVKSVFPQTEITKLLASQSLPPRIISMEDGVLTPDFGAYYGWENIDGYQANNIRRYLETFAEFDARTSGNKKVFTKMVSLVEPKSPAIDLLGADYVFSPYLFEDLFNDPNYQRVLTEGQITMYENKNSIPRFSLSQEDLSNVSDLELMKTRQVQFGKGPDISSIRVEEYQPNYFTLDINSTKENQTLQTMVTLYPGWEASVDGIPKKLTVNKDGFIGVEVPSGNSQVKFKFNPPSFKIGLIISVLSVVLLFALPLGYRLSPRWKKSQH